MTKGRCKYVFLGLVVWAGLCLYAALGQYPFLYVLFVFTFCYFCIFLLAKAFAWQLVPSQVRQDYHEHVIRFNLIVIGCLILFILGCLAVNNYYLLDAHYPTKLLGWVGLLMATYFLAQSLAKRHIRRATICIIVFIVFIGLASVLGSLKSTKGVIDWATVKKQLRSLPYLDWVPVQDGMSKSGVVKYDKALSYQGVNIFASNSLLKAFLMDMSGQILHTWVLPDELFESGGHHGWTYAELCENGDILGFVKSKVLFRLDWDSNIKWILEGQFHHDFYIGENGDIYAIMRKESVLFWHGLLPVPIIEDYISIISSNGQIKDSIPIFRAVRGEIPFDRFVEIYETTLNPLNFVKMLWRKVKRKGVFQCNTALDLHTNSIELMDRDVPYLGEKGDILISIRNLDLVMIIEKEDKRVVWKWGPGQIENQHHPTLLKNNNILIFDNGTFRGYSCVIELNPVSKEVVWEYRSKPEEKFFSAGMGASQRLPNGNTLITESDRGHVFEVTPDGNIVWDFYNFDISPDGEERRTIYRLMRIVNAQDYPQLRSMLEKKNAGKM